MPPAEDDPVEDDPVEDDPVEDRDNADEGSDAQVMVRARRDPRAFATIFDRHHEAIYRFLSARIGSDAADDLAAEVFQIAFERREDYDPDYASAKPWLFGIAANLVKRHRREGAKRHRARERMQRPDRSTTDPEQRLHELAPSSPVADALMELPERDRDTLLTYVWGGLSYEEVAEALDVPVGTVRSRLHRARGALRDRLGSETEGERDSEGGDGDG